MNEFPLQRRWLWRKPLIPPTWEAVPELHNTFHSADAAIACSIDRARAISDGGLDRDLLPLRTYLPCLHHPLSVKFPPVHRPINLSRSRMEERARSSVLRETAGTPLALPAIDLVRMVARHVVGDDRFRATQIATSRDPAGRHVVYPGPEHIESQLLRLDRFLAESAGMAVSFRAIVTALMVSNCHALPDGNGRVSRVLFNLIASAGRPVGEHYLPLYEIGILARGGYIVRLRQAELRGEWGPLAGYVLAMIRFWNQQMTAVANPTIDHNASN